MPRGAPLPLIKIQRALWDRSNRHGRVKLNQGELAAEFGVTKFTMSRKINAMIDQGRLVAVSAKGNNRGYFLVTDPDEADDDDYSDSDIFTFEEA